MEGPLTPRVAGDPGETSAVSSLAHPRLSGQLSPLGMTPRPEPQASWLGPCRPHWAAARPVGAAALYVKQKEPFVRRLHHRFLSARSGPDQAEAPAQTCLSAKCARRNNPGPVHGAGWPGHPASTPPPATAGLTEHTRGVRKAQATELAAWSGGFSRETRPCAPTSQCAGDTHGP